MQSIKTYNTKEFLGRYTEPDQNVRGLIRQDYGRFFIVPVEDMIMASKVPVPPTRSTNHSLIYLTEGVATMKIGPHSVEIGQDQCLVVPATQIFSYQKYEVNKGFLCHFNNEFLIGKLGSRELLKDFEFLTVWGNPVIHPSAETATFLRSAFHRILLEYAQNELTNTTLIQAQLLAALCDLNTCYLPLSRSRNNTSVSLTNRFKELVHRNIRQKHMVTDYASLLHVSPNHLTKIVREITGKAPSKWIDETLVTEAKILLLQTHHSIRQIAADLGIEDHSYFSRLFKKYEGTTPLQYRKMIEKS